MQLSGGPTDAVWFRTTDRSRPNFFLEASAFRPQLCRHFDIDTPYEVNMVFKRSYYDFPSVDRLLYGNGGSRQVYLYPRHAVDPDFH